MPPKDKDQPDIIERPEFQDWIVKELKLNMKDKGGFQADLDPKKGNYIDHKLLFGKMPEGIKLLPTSSPARIWRISPQEHFTRLNELINTEPAYDPRKPGLRAHGDAVPTNHGGELKLYFGTDRIIHWQGAEVEYATAIKGVPAVLSSDRKYGFENYAHFYSVNSAQATQTMSLAEDLLRYMAYGPLSIAQPDQITDDPKSYKFKGDVSGTPRSLLYSTKVVRPMTPVYDLMQEAELTAEGIRKAVDYVFEAVTFRPPSSAESESYVQIVKDSVAKVGPKDGVFMGLSSIFLHRDALFRAELVEQGKPDEYGRVMMQDWELGLAVNHALRYLKPDEELRKAIVEGRMRTREDVRREVTRMLDDDSIRKPRVLTFFRDYFDYDLGGCICKDNQALTRAGGAGAHHYRVMFDASKSTDRLIELILAEDKNVFKEMLTTQKVVAVGSQGNIYFGRKYTLEEEERSRVMIAERTKKLAKLKAQIDELRPKIRAEQEALKKNPEDEEARARLEKFEKENLALSQERTKTSPPQNNHNEQAMLIPADLKGSRLFARVGPRSFGQRSPKPDRILATAPKGERLGILTHPSWLVSQSDAMDNHAIHRGIWVRERLLGGGIPDVPITVNAQLPDEPEKTLCERMRVTREPYCWSCHEKMDPLGLPFEIYNHVGLYRTADMGKPVDATGEIVDSGDPSLDGPVNNTIEMIEKLANSERVEQGFIRHAFRFWMGRTKRSTTHPCCRRRTRLIARAAAA